MDCCMDMGNPLFSTKMGKDAARIIRAALNAAQPDTAVRRALADLPAYSGRLLLVSVGKAAWQMARAAYDILGGRIDDGIVVTKYGHAKGAVGKLRIREAGHPVPDTASYRATQEAMELTGSLCEGDLVLFLLSGGGSALLEKPLLSPREMDDITRQLLACGADIVEMNTVRKRLSAVKGGRFARLCAPARVFSVVLSDVLGDPLDMIASGPAYPDGSTCAQALAVAEKYHLRLSDEARTLLMRETPKYLANAEARITGSVRQLCAAAAKTCAELGYEPVTLTAGLNCEAREAGSFLASIARYHGDSNKSLAFIAGGETVVRLTGRGMGGRNQELALAAARGIDGMKETLLFSIGSDGTDGPTDAAGGIVTGETAGRLRDNGYDIDAALKENDSYPALKAADGLIFTGPTGTNVNDLSCLLLKRP